MSATLRPLSDRVLIERVKRAERSTGGIYIPETASEVDQSWQGVVLAVGPGKTNPDGQRIEPRVKTGDGVVVGKYQGTEVTIDGTELVVVRETDIQGVIED